MRDGTQFVDLTDGSITATGSSVVTVDRARVTAQHDSDQCVPLASLKDTRLGEGDCDKHLPWWEADQAGIPDINASQFDGNVNGIVSDSLNLRTSS